MGEISKAITIDVPSDVVYNAIKNVDANRYTADLRQGLTPPPALIKDIENNLLVYKSSSWGTKIEAEYSLRPVGDSSCEISITMKYKLTLSLSVRQCLIQDIYAFLMLEMGYKAGRTQKNK